MRPPYDRIAILPEGVRIELKKAGEALLQPMGVTVDLGIGCTYCIDAPKTRTGYWADNGERFVFLRICLSCAAKYDISRRQVIHRKAVILVPRSRIYAGYNIVKVESWLREQIASPPMKYLLQVARVMK